MHTSRVARRTVATLSTLRFRKNALMATICCQSFSSNPSNPGEKSNKEKKAKPDIPNALRLKMFNRENRILFGTIKRDKDEKGGNKQSKKQSDTQPKKETVKLGPSDNDSPAKQAANAKTKKVRVKQKVMEQSQSLSDEHPESSKIASVFGSIETHTSNSIHVKASSHEQNVSSSPLTESKSETPTPDKKESSNGTSPDELSGIASPRKLSEVPPVEEYGTSSISSIISIPFEKKGNPLPSVTRVLSETMPPEQRLILEKWEKRMREQMGDEGFQRYRAAMFSNGRLLHANIQKVLSGTPEEELLISQGITGHWRSLRSVVMDMKQVQALESRVTHPQLQYSGIVDCVAQFRDKLLVVDWKTSEKPKPVVTMTYDTPLQIAAYIGAVNEDPNYAHVKIREGLIVVAYQSGNVCETFFLTENDVAIAWEKWIRRLTQYRQMQEKREQQQLQQDPTGTITDTTNTNADSK